MGSVFLYSKGTQRARQARQARLGRKARLACLAGPARLAGRGPQGRGRLTPARFHANFPGDEIPQGPGRTPCSARSSSPCSWPCSPLTSTSTSPSRPDPSVRLALASAVSYGPIVVLATVVFFFLVQFFSGRRFALKVVSPSFLAVAFSLLIVALSLHLLGEPAVTSRRSSTRPTAPWSAPRGSPSLVLAISGAGALYRSRRLGRSPCRWGPISRSSPPGLLLARRTAGPVPLPAAGQRTGRLEARKIGRNVCPHRPRRAEPRFRLPLIAEGKLPNFSWLVDNGSWGRLGTLRPDASAPHPRPLAQDRQAPGQAPPDLPRTLTEPAFRAPRLEVTPRFILFRQMIRLGLLEILPNVPPPAATDLGRIFEANGSSALVVAPPPAETRGDPDPRADKAFGPVFKIDGSETGRLVEAGPQGVHPGLGPRRSGVRREGPPGSRDSSISSSTA